MLLNKDTQKQGALQIYLAQENILRSFSENS